MVTHAIFLINRIPNPLLRGLSPFEKLHNKAPDYHILKPFGCLCYVSALTHQQHKFDARAHASVFLGFKIGMKGYIFYALTNREINVTHNAIFSELTFPYQSQPQINPSVSPAGPIHEDPLLSLPLLSLLFH